MINREMTIARTITMPKQPLVAEPVNWAQWLCPTAFCATDLLLVQHATDHEDLWRVKEGINGQPWLVASTLPGCPFCGATLEPAGKSAVLLSAK
jgi:hypothetical protein